MMISGSLQFTISKGSLCDLLFQEKVANKNVLPNQSFNTSVGESLPSKASFKIQTVDVRSSRSP